jgi:hypothetical protein
MTRARARLLLAPLLVTAAVGGSCRAPDPKQELALEGIETYWAIARSVGETHYLAPVVRFEIRAKGASPLRSVQATATFRRKGEESRDWGSAFEQVVVPRKPLAPGQTLLVLLISDTHYYTSGPPEGIFTHELFKDAKVEVFLRVGSSSFVKFGEADVERRIGSRSVPDALR